MSENRVTVDRRGPLLLIGLNRPEKRNAADLAMLEQLALAYGELDRDPALRVGVVHAHGEHFTAGLDLGDLAPRIGPEGLRMVPEGGINPWGTEGEQVSKPVVLAVQGTCLTLGVELALASSARISVLRVAGRACTDGWAPASRTNSGCASRRRIRASTWSAWCRRPFAP